MKAQHIRTYESLAVMRRKFIAMSSYIKNTEKNQRNDQMLNLKFLEKQEPAKPKSSRKE
jgi:hypothetical protein